MCRNIGISHILLGFTFQRFQKSVAPSSHFPEEPAFQRLQKSKKASKMFLTITGLSCFFITKSNPLTENNVN